MSCELTKEVTCRLYDPVGPPNEAVVVVVVVSQMMSLSLSLVIRVRFHRQIFVFHIPHFIDPSTNSLGPLIRSWHVVHHNPLLIWDIQTVIEKV